MKHWIAVASAEHARRGKVGFMQVNHGKAAPLRRISPGDGVVYYSPTESFGGKDKLRAFTLIGRVKDGDIYPGEMGGWTAYRRSVDWSDAHDAPIPPCSTNSTSVPARRTGATRCASACSRSPRTISA